MNDDRALVASFLARRDERSFRALYRAYTPCLYRFTVRFLGADAASDVEDVVQETWIRVVRRLPTFEWRSSLRTWLIGIAINCARETMRRHLQTTSVLPYDNGSTAEMTLDLENAIAHLADGARAVFCLHDIEGYTHEEIAGLLDISEGTSKSQLSAARKRLRQRLGGNT